MAAHDLTAARLRELVDYDGLTGLFTRRVRTGSSIAGKVLGTVHKHGYVVIRLDYKLYKAHRLAWLHVIGEWPANEIDHIDGDRSNNRIANLRDVSRRVNAENMRAAKPGSRSGLLGVEPHGKFSFRAQIKVNGTMIRLGSFPTKELAHAVYVSAKRRLHEGNTL